MNATDLIGQYIKLREYVAKRTAEHAEELKPYNDAMETIENRCGAMLIEQGGEEGKANIATPAGTVFRKRWTSIGIADRPTFFAFVGDDWADRQKFLTAAVAKKEIEEFIEVNKFAPPGLNIARGYSVQFNKPKG